MSLSKFFILIGNELRKIFVQKSFVVTLLVLFIPVLILGRWDFVEKQLGTSKEENWKSELIDQNKESEKTIAELGLGALSEQDKEQYEIYKYRIKHNISTVQQYSVLDFMKKGAAITNFIGILLIYFASSMMSKEHQWKTINFLLVKPSTRRTIFYTKFISLGILYFVFTFAILLYSFIIGSALNGMKFSTQPVLMYVNNKVIEQGILPSLLHDYFINFLPFLLFIAIAYFLSTILKSGSVSLLISIILFATSDVIASLLRAKSWSKYLPFMHTDLTVYIKGVNIENGMSIWFSIMMLILYTLLFLIIAGEVFKKRDVI